MRGFCFALGNMLRPASPGRGLTACGGARGLRVALVVEAPIHHRPIGEPFPGIELSDYVPATAVQTRLDAPPGHRACRVPQPGVDLQQHIADAHRGDTVQAPRLAEATAGADGIPHDPGGTGRRRAGLGALGSAPQWRRR